MKEVEDQKLTFQISVKKISSNPFNSIIHWKNVYTLSIFNIGTLVHRDNITKPNPKIAPHDLVHPYFRLITSIISKSNAYRVFPLLTLNPKYNVEIYTNKNNWELITAGSSQ